MTIFGRLCGRGSALRNRRGVAALEFALVAPALFLLTIGIIDVGRMMWTASSLGHAAREGARYATVHAAESVEPASDATVEAFVADRVFGIDPANLSVSIAWSPNSNPGSTVTITVDYQYNSLLVGFIGRDPISLQSSSTLSIL